MAIGNTLLEPRSLGGRIDDAIGNTPLLRLGRIAADAPGVEVYGKAEWLNPGGSVKDRPALAMILDGERSGRLVAGRTILDATSGNTGIAYAMIGAARGYSVRLCLPANATDERKRILRIYGADLVLTDPAEGTDGAIRAAREIYAAEPERYFYPDQYNNPANWRAHYATTANEVWEQTGGRVTHFVAALGTTGTFVGTGRRLRELKPHVRLVSVEPDGPFHGLEGMKHLETAIVPGIFDASLADEREQVSTEEAYETTRRLAREEGILAGISSGAAVAAALRVARRGREGVVVTVGCDGGRGLLGDRVWFVVVAR
jgi:cysteine synthase B